MFNKSNFNTIDSYAGNNIEAAIKLCNAIQWGYNFFKSLEDCNSSTEAVSKVAAIKKSNIDVFIY